MQNHVAAHPVKAIALKGISRRVVPHVTDKSLVLKAQPPKDVVAVSADRLDLNVNLTGISDVERHVIRPRCAAVKVVPINRTWYPTDNLWVGKHRELN